MHIIESIVVLSHPCQPPKRLIPPEAWENSTHRQAKQLKRKRCPARGVWM